jgi:hypothetical protein
MKIRMDCSLPSSLSACPGCFCWDLATKKRVRWAAYLRARKLPLLLGEGWGEQAGRACNPTPNDLLKMSGCNPDLLGTFCHFERSEKSFSHCLKISPHFDRRKDNILLPPKT